MMHANTNDNVNSFSNITFPDWSSDFSEKSTFISALSYQEFTGTIEQPTSDNHLHRLIRLPNNMVVLCIQAPDVKLATAALCVNVGNFADPPELQGLAHLLEHLLFMSSEKYPDEEGYKQFISDSGGDCNACTGSDHTTYHFYVDNNALEKALDRFAQFFISPLLSEDLVSREVNAVDSEYKGDICDEVSQFYRLLSSTCKPSHPLSKFDIGSSETLTNSALKHNLSLHDEIIKFYNKYYSSDIMKLVIIGNHSLDHLTEWAVSLFSNVPSKGDTRYIIDSQPYTENELGKSVHYNSLVNENKISMLFQLPSTKQFYQTNPTEYLESLLEDKGPGSLFCYLKQSGWATDIVSFSSYSNYNFNQFVIDVTATTLGIKQYKDIIRAILTYLQMIIKQGPMEWYYNQIKLVKDMDFKYQQIDRNHIWAEEFAKNMSNAFLEPKNILSQSDLLASFNPTVIADILKHFNSNNYQVIVGAEKINNFIFDLVEPHYNIIYCVNQLPSYLTLDFKVSDRLLSKFSIPKPNKYISEQPTITKPSTDCLYKAKVPELLRLDNKLELWFKKDDQFYTPIGVIHIRLYVPDTINSPYKSLLAEIYCNSMDAYLTQELHYAKSAGYYFNIKKASTAIDIIVYGFSNKLNSLLNDILDKMYSVQISEQLFNAYLEEIKSDYYKELRGEPYDVAYTYINSIFNEGEWTSEAIINELDNIDLAKTKEFAKTVFEKTFIRMYISGHFEEQDAMKAARIVETKLNYICLPKCIQKYPRTMLLDLGYFVNKVDVSSAECVNNAVLTYIYCGQVSNIHDNVISCFLFNMIYSPFFDKLRTKEQLGYVVITNGGNYIQGRSFIELVVQGENNPVYMTKRINAFLREYRSELARLSSEEIKSIIGARIESFLDNPKTIYQESVVNWDQMNDGTYNFDYQLESANVLQKVTKEDILKFWDKYINTKTAQQYCRIDCQMWSKSIFQPSEKDMEKYPTSVVALHGCLHKAGLDSLDIATVGRIIKNACTEDTVDTLLEEIKAIYVDAPHVDKIILETGSKPHCVIKTALEMATEDIRNPVFYNIDSDINYRNAGMCPNPEGIWLIKDVDEFKTMHPFHGKPNILSRFAPKYLTK